MSGTKRTTAVVWRSAFSTSRMRSSARSGSAIHTWSGGVLLLEIVRDPVDAAEDRETVDHSLGARVVVEAAHVETAPRRGAQPRGDLAAVRARRRR